MKNALEWIDRVYGCRSDETFESRIRAVQADALRYALERCRVQGYKSADWFLCSVIEKLEGKPWSGIRQKEGDVS